MCSLSIRPSVRPSVSPSSHLVVNAVLNVRLDFIDPLKSSISLRLSLKSDIQSATI